MALAFEKPFRQWKQGADEKPVEEIVRMYRAGFAGAGRDDEAKERLLKSVAWPNGSAAAHHFGLADSAAGELVPAWLGVEKLFPGCWPGSAQTRGDCVSHSTRNGGLTAVAGDILSGLADKETGKLEGPPEDISTTGRGDGIFSSEAIYWWRDHGGDGWSCGHAASVLRTESGLWVRKAYPELNVDLSKYSGKTAGLYGSRNPPAEFLAEGAKHRIREVTELSSFEEVRDYLANGYGISTCGGEGWSSSRDENGVSKRQGSWAHALAIIGADDRAVVKQKYGGPLVLILNSWENWNSGGRRVLGTPHDIPHGAYWSRWDDAKRRDIYAFSGVKGWPKRRITFIGTDPRYSLAT